MNTTPFVRMGAEVMVNQRAHNFRLNCRAGRFEIDAPASVSIEVLDCQPKDRHLLLLARVPDARGRITKQKFLCGHDERDWFAASVADHSTNVANAKDSLRPAAVNEALRQAAVPVRRRHDRRNAAYIRQGEWFFVPAPNLRVDERLVLKSDRLIRPGGGKPHIVQELYRTGGTDVMVHSRHAPDGLILANWRNLPTANRTDSGWRPMRRDPEAYARGTVRHSDHATIALRGWHRIHLNAETRRSTLGFLD